jgi:hypothetical protein
MTSTLSVLTLGSVASLLIATFYQGDPYTKHKLWNIVSTKAQGPIGQEGRHLPAETILQWIFAYVVQFQIWRRSVSEWFQTYLLQSPSKGPNNWISTGSPFSFCLLFVSFHFLHISLFRFAFVGFVSFRFHFVDFVSFRFVFVDFVSFLFRVSQMTMSMRIPWQLQSHQSFFRCQIYHCA